MRHALLLVLRHVPFFIVAAACGAPPIDDDVVASDLSKKFAADADAAPPDVCNTEGGAQITLRASAPLGINDSHLGQPSGAHFEPIAGDQGKSLFPEAKVRTTAINNMEHKFEAVESTRGFDANVSVSYAGFGVGVEGGKATTKRYATYSASQVADVHEIDEATKFRTAPPGATWYLARIFYGHQYSVVFSGEQKRMNAGVKASFFGIVGGGVKKFGQDNDIQFNAIGRGMTPVGGDAIFAKTPEEIQKAYASDGPAVPIFVEYRTIPRACVPPDQQIKWLAPRRVRLTFDSIDVYSRGGDGWTMEAKCTIDDKEIALEKPQIWSNQRLGDDCKSDVPGPKGNATYCPYNLYFAAPLAAMDGDIINCGVQGKQGNGSALAYSQFTFRLNDKSPATFKGEFGDGGNGVEYRVHYGLEIEPAVAGNGATLP